VCPDTSACGQRRSCAGFGWRLGHLPSRCRLVFPLLAGIGLAAHSAANAASERSRSGLSVGVRIHTSGNRANLCHADLFRPSSLTGLGWHAPAGSGGDDSEGLLGRVL
jgi:hypothetical protein